MGPSERLGIDTGGGDGAGARGREAGWNTSEVLGGMSAETDGSSANDTNEDAAISATKAPKKNRQNRERKGAVQHTHSQERVLSRVEYCGVRVLRYR
jgi:hypothetical protein